MKVDSKVIDYIPLCYLELKPISDITDKDARKLGFEKKFDIEFYNMLYPLDAGIIDYLRGKGYALEWTTPNGETITVEQQIEWGWIKLKSNKKLNT